MNYGTNSAVVGMTLKELIEAEIERLEDWVKDNQYMGYSVGEMSRFLKKLVKELGKQLGGGRDE